ncbi:MAG: hypothetical protein KDK70_08595, partial [Myxococcales bacterium]|nr:hypothetical protein [Myxococcales bacterium]
MVATGLAAWSPSAEACGLGVIGRGAAAAVMPALLVVLLLSAISLLSLRAASRAFGRMLERRPSRGIRWARAATLVGYGISVLGTVVSGGLLLALGLLR